MPRTPFNPPYPKPPKSKELNRPFAVTLQTLLKSRKITGKEMASRLGLSEQTLSDWRNWNKRPHPSHFDQLVDELRLSKDERQLITRAYEQPLSYDFQLEDIPEDKKRQVGHMKAKLAMIERSRPARLRRQVHDILQANEVAYEENCVLGDVAFDYMLRLYFEENDQELGFKETVERRIAILCNANSGAEYDDAMNLYLRSGFLIDDVLMIVPEDTELSPNSRDMMTPSMLKRHLRELKEASTVPPMGEEELNFQQAAKTQLERLDIKTTTKQGADCIEGQGKRPIALLYAYDLSTGLEAISAEAADRWRQLKATGAIVVIPNGLGIGHAVMENGVRIVAISHLSKETVLGGNS